MSKQQDEKGKEEQKNPGNLKDEKVDVPRPGKEKQKKPGKSTKAKGKEKEKEKKKGCFNCRNCGCSCLIVLIILITLPLYALAASGAVNIPLLTPLVYGDDPKPREQVEAVSISEDVIGKKVEEAVKNNSKTISLSEEELTGLLKSQGGIPKLNISINEENIEFFGNVQNGPYNVLVTLQQVPKIEDGQLNVDIDKARIGKLNLPLIIVNPIVDNSLKSYQEQISERIKHIEDIELKQDKVLITADWRKMAKEQMEEEMKKQSEQPSKEEVPQKIQGL